jgi:hypothetical protein
LIKYFNSMGCTTYSRATCRLITNIRRDCPRPQRRPVPGLQCCSPAPPWRRNRVRSATVRHRVRVRGRASDVRLEQAVRSDEALFSGIHRRCSRNLRTPAKMPRMRAR